MAKNFNKSEYAVNKYSVAIVYLGSKGAYELTEEEFLCQNPGMTHEDFLFWKNWSDEDYKEELRAETETKKHTISIHELEETKVVCQPSAEDEYVMQESEKWKGYSIEQVLPYLSILTPLQRKRFVAHYYCGFSTVDIANFEGVRQNAVWESIEASRIKIKNFLKKF